MSISHSTFAGSIPENYHCYLVPLIFDAYGADLASRLELPEGGAVLETACGTGIVTGHILAGLPDGARVTATDLNPGMIDRAREHLGDHGALTLQQADATDLPFENGAFDAVVCQFGVMFFPDKAKGYGEAARVLKPGGQYLLNVWDSLANNHLSKAAHEAVAALFPEDPPDFLELPFGYHDLTAILRGLQAAGFADVQIAVQPRVSRAPDAGHVARAFCAGSPLANQLAQRAQPSAEQVIESVTESLAAQFGSGPVEAPMQAFQISARKAG